MLFLENCFNFTSFLFIYGSDVMFVWVFLCGHLSLHVCVFLIFFLHSLFSLFVFFLFWFVWSFCFLKSDKRWVGGVGLVRGGGPGRRGGRRNCDQNILYVKEDLFSILKNLEARQ